MKKQSGFASIIAVIIALLVVAGIGFLYYQTSQKGKTTTTETASDAPASAEAGPYDGWKTYSSTYEGVSFKYPADWTINTAYDHLIPQDDTTSDGAQLVSPSGKVKVSWISKVDGIGGACDDTIPVGAEGACPLYKVLETKELPNLGAFYYAAGVTTSDGTTYTPWMGIQSKRGILTDQRSLGLLAFEGKHDNTIFLNGGDSVTGSGLPGGTETEAKAFFETTEGKQAVLILQSARY